MKSNKAKRPSGHKHAATDTGLWLRAESTEVRGPQVQGLPASITVPSFWAALCLKSLQ